jgi:hypothetical protein
MKILMVLTSHDQLGITGTSEGAYREQSGVGLLRFTTPSMPEGACSAPRISQTRSAQPDATGARSRLLSIGNQATGGEMRIISSWSACSRQIAPETAL